MSVTVTLSLFWLRTAEIACSMCVTSPDTPTEMLPQYCTTWPLWQNIDQTLYKTNDTGNQDDLRKPYTYTNLSSQQTLIQWTFKINSANILYNYRLSIPYPKNLESSKFKNLIQVLTWCCKGGVFLQSKLVLDVKWLFGKLDSPGPHWHSRGLSSLQCIHLLILFMVTVTYLFQWYFSMNKNAFLWAEVSLTNLSWGELCQQMCSFSQGSVPCVTVH